MGYLLFFQLVTSFLGGLLSSNILGSDLLTFESFGRISWNRPSPPPPIFSSTPVEEFPLRPFFAATTATIITTPTSVLLENVTSSAPSPPLFTQTDPSSPPVSILHQQHTGIIGQLVQVFSWVFSIAIAILVAILQTLTIIAPLATVAYTLRQQRRQDLANLDVGGVASLDDFWDQINQVNDQDWIVAALRDDLARITREAEAQRKEQDAFVQTLQLGQDAFVQTLRKEHDVEMQALQVGQDAKVQALRQEQDADVQTLRMGQDALVQSLRKEEAKVQTLQKGQDVVEQTLLELREEKATSENTIAELKLTIAEALQRLTEGKEEADQRILDLKQTLETERQSARKKDDDLAAAREQTLEAEQQSARKDDDLKAARDNIASLQSTISSNSQELLMYRSRARAQHQFAHGQRPPPPPPPMQMQIPPAPFLPRPSGMPPNHTSGFMGNAPPPPTPPMPMPMPMPMQFPSGPPAPFVPRPSGMPPNRTSGFMGSAPPPGWGQ